MNTEPQPASREELEALIDNLRKQLSDSQAEVEMWKRQMGLAGADWVAMLAQFIRVPTANGYHADRYDTDDKRVLHLWNDSGESFDFELLKAERRFEKRIGDSFEELTRLRTELSESQKECENYKAMKDGVSIRIADLEAEVERLNRTLETKESNWGILDEMYQSNVKQLTALRSENEGLRKEVREWYCESW